MTFEELFRGYWWLMFPIFGMVMAFVGMFQTEDRSRQVMKLIKSYLDQGKEPPPELLKMAQERSDYEMDFGVPAQRSSGLWSFVVFLALSAGFGVGYWWIREESYSFAFLIVAVTMGVLAVGSLIIALTQRRP
jgi:Flp pilus assembly protein TadB